jgi:2-aminoadipate transaminase
MIVRHSKRYGIHITPDNVLITSGSQQALDFIGKVFINPGDRILVENPTYLGALQAWNVTGRNTSWLPMDEDRHQTEKLESLLRRARSSFYAAEPTTRPA